MSGRLRPAAGRPALLRALTPVLAATAAAELARRGLTPRTAVRAPVEVSLADHFTTAEIDRGRRYARPQRRLALARSGLELVALTALVVRPPALLRAADRRPLAGAAAVAAGLSVGLTLPGLPLRAVARRRAIAAGLDTQAWGAWAADLAKAEAIGAVMSAGAGAGVTALARRRPHDWWLAAAAGSVVLGAALGALAPVVLDPLFNDFEPLAEGETRADVLALASGAGVSVGEVYSVDASRRTTAANAYVTGLGPTKRVVLFDTMLDRYDRDEIRLVVAHELGHLRHRDVPRNVAFVALAAPGLAWAVQRLAAELGAAAPTPSALPTLALAATVVSAPLAPIAAALSRAMERRADEFSLTLAGAPHAFVSFERRVAVQNVADLQPRWLARRLASHPPTAERIGAALAFQGAAAGAAAGR